MMPVRMAGVVDVVTAPLRPVTPLIVRVVAGVVMIAHATHFTPAEFGAILGRRVGLPFPDALAWTGTVLLYAGGALLLIAALLVVFVTGPGPVSLDRLIGWDNGWSPARA